MWLCRKDSWQYIEEESSVPDSKWKKDDGKALATIVLACERTQYSLVQQCKSVKQTWAALKKRHDHISIPASAVTVKK